MTPFLWPAVSAAAAIEDSVVTLNSEDFSGPISDWSWTTPGFDEPFSAWSQAVNRNGLSPTTGPNGGADPVSRAVVSGNAYAYTEASNPGDTVWTMESPTFDVSLGTVVLSFDFHMRFGRTGGQTDGTLVVQGWDGTKWSKIGKAIVGSQHRNANDAYLPSTRFGRYSSDGYTNRNFKFRFLFAEGSGGGTFPYDCALDNIKVDREGGPPPSPVPPNPIPATGIIQSFRGEDGVENFPGVLNFPVPERSHNRQTITRPAGLVPFGSASMLVEIKPGDPQWNVDAAVRPRTAKRRAEFSWRPFRFEPGEEGWVGAAFYLPSDPMASVRGCTIFQLHNHPDPGEMMQIHLFDGRLRIVNENRKGARDLLNTALEPYLDRWVRLVINFRPSTRNNGFIKLWLDDDKVIDVNGPNKPGGTLGPYFKHGTYFWGYGKFDRNRRAACYYDNLRIGDRTSNFESVDPANFA